MIDPTGSIESSPATQKPSPPKGQASTYLYFLSLYFVAVGVLYLWGYWSAFNVNILEYLTLADIIKSSVFPIASTFSLIILGTVFGDLMAGDRTSRKSGGGASKIKRILRENSRQAWGIYILTILTLFMFGPIYKWFVLSLLFAVPPYMLASQQGLLATVIRHERSRGTVLMLLAVLPTFAFGTGRMNAQDIIDGDRFEFVLSPIDQIQVPSDAEPIKRPRFLGHAGDFLFFLEPVESKLAISKIEDGQTLLLKRHTGPIWGILKNVKHSQSLHSTTTQ